MSATSPIAIPPPLLGVVALPGFAPHKCREPEVRIIFAARAFANFGFKSGTRIIDLLVSFRFRSSY
jgi:hypothetical protein